MRIDSYVILKSCILVKALTRLSISTKVTMRLPILTKPQPFLILSDINMPRLNGFELRNMVFTNEQLQTKCIPYLFFTTAADKKSVVDAYTMSVQGFFVKPNSMRALENAIRKIVEYWQECIAPNQFD